MLLSLRIQNIALMEEMRVDFSTGLHALTGETGAGKSILVDAVALLLGGRAQKELIRAGAEKARVEGIFSLKDCAGAQAFLCEQELDEGGEMVLAREITLQGRSSCRVNGTLLPLGQYQQLTALLMDIHGQHEHQFLMDEKRHLSFLDAYGEEEHHALLAAVRHQYEAWHAARKEWEEARRQSEQAEERMELLRLEGQTEQIIRESKEFFHFMAERTHTLWEHNNPTGSLNHGFAAYAANFIVEAVTGIAGYDAESNTILMSTPQIMMDCQARIPFKGDWITVDFKQDQRNITFPEGVATRLVSR